MADDRVRIELGFAGGQIVGSFVDARSADALEAALGFDGSGQAASSSSTPRTVRCTSSSRTIAYYKRIVRAGRVGFGSG